MKTSCMPEVQNPLRQYQLMLSKPNHDFCEVDLLFNQAWRECWMRTFPFRTSGWFGITLKPAILPGCCCFSFHFPVHKTVILLILHLLITASRTRIPYVRDILVSCCVNFLWKLLLVVWQTEHQVPPSIQPSSLEAPYWPTIMAKN